MLTSKTLSVLMLTAAVCLAPAVSIATPGADSSDSIRMQMKSVAGEIKSVDASSGTLVIEDSSGASVTINLAEDATITIDGRSGTLTDVKEGQVAVAMVESQASGKLVAKSVSVRSP